MAPASPDARAPVLQFIGRIETPYRRLEDCPRNIQPDGPPCRLILNPEYADGLLGLEAGRRVLVLYWLDADRRRLRQESRRTGEYAGVFALRSPHRPNPIGAGTVTVEGIEGNILTVRGLDCLDGTPLLDIKPAMDGRSPRRDSSGPRVPVF